MRKKSYMRNKELSIYLEKLNDNLKQSQSNLIIEKGSYLPYIFIVGAPRSGTTLSLQLISSINEIAYPNNFTARFYKAPLFGALIDKILFDEKLDFHSETFLEKEIKFKSDLGKTSGLLQPNEYWFLWRYILYGDNFLNNEIEDIDKLPMHKLNNHYNKSVIESIPKIYEKPYLAKGLLFNYALDKIANIFSNVIFIYIKRDIPSNVASLKKAREKYFGDDRIWYSFKIPEYKYLIKFNNVYKEIAGQIYFNNLAIERGLKSLPESKKIVMNYEDLCSNPKELHNKLKDILFMYHKYRIGDYNGPESFKYNLTLDDSYRAIINEHLNFLKESF